MTRLTQCDKIINTIRANGYVTSRQMIDMGIFKYSSRIADLRKKGYAIRAERVNGTLYRYLLDSEPKREMTVDEANSYIKNLNFEAPKKQGSLL